jgi:hypothetical protein
MSNRTARYTPPAAPPRYKLALVTWAGAWLLAATPAPAQGAQTPARGSRSRAHAGRAG